MHKLLVMMTAAVLLASGASQAATMEAVHFDHRSVAVIDGDTIQVGAKVLQLEGIDAPELGQACDNGGHYWLCGLSAAYELRRLIAMQMGALDCYIEPQGGPVGRAQCLTAGFDLAFTMISSGLAVAAPDSPMHYRTAEHQAREAAVGIWAGPFVDPADWRRDVRLPGEHAFAASSHLHGQLPWKVAHGSLSYEPRAEHAACLVKGVVEGSERVFYGPLDSEYETIRLDPARGDRLFCGDDLARVAGWRHKGARVN